MGADSPEATGSSSESLRPFWALVLIGFGIWGLMHLFPALRAVAFLAFFGLVLASVFEYPIAFLARWVPRLVATLLVLVALLMVGAGLAILIVPRFVDQVNRMVAAFPAAMDRVREISRSLPGGHEPSHWIQQAQDQLLGMAHQVIPAAVAALAGLANGFLALVLAFFLAHRPDDYLGAVLRLIPRGREAGVHESLVAGGRALRGWLLGVLVSMSAVGVLTGLGLLLIGLDLWLALGVLAFFGAFVPFLGPVLTAIPGLAVGLAQSPSMMLKVLLVYVIVQQIEGNVAQPLAMRWAVRIPPALLLIWQLAFTAAFGIGGLLVATPLLAALKGLLQRGYVEGTLGKQA